MVSLHPGNTVVTLLGSFWTILIGKTLLHCCPNPNFSCNLDSCLSFCFVDRGRNKTSGRAVGKAFQCIAFLYMCGRCSNFVMIL